MCDDLNSDLSLGGFVYLTMVGDGFSKKAESKLLPGQIAQWPLKL